MDIKTRNFIPKIERIEVVNDFYSLLHNLPKKVLNQRGIYYQIRETNRQSGCYYIDSLVYLPKDKSGAGIVVGENGSGILPVKITGTAQSIKEVKKILENLAETENTRLVGLKLIEIKKK